MLSEVLSMALSEALKSGKGEKTRKKGVSGRNLSGVANLEGRGQTATPAPFVGY